MKLTAEQNRELLRTLRKFDKELYRIHKYENGKLVGTEGKLPVDELQAGLVEQVQKEAEATSYSGASVQAGSKKGTSQTRRKTAQRAGSSTRLRCPEQFDLVSRLSKILPNPKK